MEAKKKSKLYSQVFPNIEDWPIYKLSEDRERFIEEIDNETTKRLLLSHGDRIHEVISKTIYLEKIRMKEDPWKVDPPKDKQFWGSISNELVKKGLDKTSGHAPAANEQILKRIVHRYSEEIVGNFKINTFLFARRFLTFFFTRLLNTAAAKNIFHIWGSKYHLLDRLIVAGKTDSIRTLIKDHTVVVVPTHFSNLDSILIGYAMDAMMGLPSFSYGAGLNLYNTGYTAYFMNRLGAYRVDRRKKNPIYLETLKSMSTLSLQRGVNTLFFPGGTRARSGSIEDHLKLGLLGTLIEAQRANYMSGDNKKIILVPLVLSYPFVLEAPYLIEQHLRYIGKEKYIRSKDAFYSPLRIFQFAWQFFSKPNEVTLSFGQPMDVIGNPVDDHGNSFDKYGNPIQLQEYFQNIQGIIAEDDHRESEYTRQLAARIVDRFYKDNIVVSSHIVAFAAFRQLALEKKHLDLYGILRLPTDEYVFDETVLTKLVSQLRETLLGMEKNGQLKVAEFVRNATPKEVLERGLKRLGTFHIAKPLKRNKNKQIISQSFKTLFYYHNRLDNYGLQDVLKIPDA